MKRNEAFIELCNDVAECRACPRMEHSVRVLSSSAGPLSANVMVIGEAPGRLGADATGVPFHGDVAGLNFEKLLDTAGISRSDLFITNAALCNPRCEAGNNATPTPQELRSCSAFLARQIELVDPKIVVTLGAKALQAIENIESHGLTLASGCRKKLPWNGRFLIPLYHPGQRALIHRSFFNQISDYKFLASEMKKLNAIPRRVYGMPKEKTLYLLQKIFSKREWVSYFALHKIVYLVDYEISRLTGRPFTDSYYIRQVDGPYNTDLHVKKIKSAFQKLKLNGKGERLMLGLDEDLFVSNQELSLPKEVEQAIERKIDEIVGLPDEKLKQKAYLSKPMREILKQEKKAGSGLFNQAIDLRSEED